MFSSSISYDIVTYVIVKTLVDTSRDKLDMNFGDVTQWFKNFCFFAGSFFKEYQNLDFSCIFYYLTNQLKNKNQNCYIEFLIAKEIIEKMSRIFTQETMDESQIQSSFGGIYLYLESMDLVKEYKNLKEPIQNLLKFFTSGIGHDKVISKLSLMNGFAKNLTADGGIEIEHKFNEDTKMNILDENKISKFFY